MYFRVALLALEKLNHSVLLGKSIRVMWSHRDPDARNSGIGNLFVKVNLKELVLELFILHFMPPKKITNKVSHANLQNLSDSIDSMKLCEFFSEFGTITSCKIVIQDGKSKGYGFVQYDCQESANSAIEKLNGATIDGKQMYAVVMYFGHLSIEVIKRFIS